MKKLIKLKKTMKETHKSAQQPIGKDHVNNQSKRPQRQTNKKHVKNWSKPT